MKRRDVIASRGCPYNCTYCFNHANKEIFKNKGRYLRQRSVDNLIEELQILKTNHSVKVFHFQDDVFTINRKWTIEFCEKYKEKINLNFEIQVRVNLIDEQLIKKLKDAGCTLIIYGIESGNDYIRIELLNRDISAKQILESSKLFNKYNIRTMSVNILCLPKENLQNAIETLDINIMCKPNYAWNSIYQPYPMTKLADYAIRNNYFNVDIDMLENSFLYSKSLIKGRDIKRIERLHYLFSIAVQFPKLKKLIILLIKLPLLNIFKIIFFFHRVYAAFFSLKRITFSEVIVFEKTKFYKVKRYW